MTPEKFETILERIQQYSFHQGLIDVDLESKKWDRYQRAINRYEKIATHHFKQGYLTWVKSLEESEKTLEEIIEKQKRITDKIITGKLNMAKPPDCNVCGSPRIGLSTSGEWGVKKCMACGAFGAFVFPDC